MKLIEAFDVALEKCESAGTDALDQRRGFRVGRWTLKSEKEKLSYFLFERETANILHSAFFLSSANSLSASIGVRLSTSTERREFLSSSSSAVKSGSWLITTLGFLLARTVRLSDN